MHVPFDIIAILRNLPYRCHILGLVWIFILFDADTNHHVQCLSKTAINRSPTSPQILSTAVTSNTEPLSRDDLITTSSYDVRFQDVFWSGADDGDDKTLTFSLKSNARLAAARETFVKTATVVATVYVDGNSDEDDGNDCNSIECHGDDDIDDNSLALDKRFWLITTVDGALTEDEMPIIKQQLADLYRTAFTRQQSIHLGFTTAMNTTTTELPVIIAATGEQNVSSEIRPTSVLKYESVANNRTDTHRNHSTIIVLPSINLTTIFDTGNSVQSRQQSRSVSAKKVVLSIVPTPVAPTQTQTQISLNLNDVQHAAVKRNAHDSLNHLKHGNRKRDEVTISIIIHNISVVTDDFNDAENRKEWPVKNVTRNVAIPSAGPLNQSEIIYSVLVNGNAVLAIIAAGDMELVSDVEVSHELNRVVYIKSEPYLKEPPYATPLIPSAASTELSTVFGQFVNTPNLLIFIGIVLFLLTCLLMALMLLSLGSRRPTNSKSKKLISREVQTSHIMSPSSSSSPAPHFKHERRVRSIDEYDNNTATTMTTAAVPPPPSITGHRVNTTNQVATQMTSLHGFDNFGYERDHSFILIPSPPKSTKQNKHNKKVGTPNIYFPCPPSAASTTTGTQSSGDSLSDASSIYYIKKPKRERERERDRDRLTDSRHRGRVYATILRKPSNRKASNHVAKQKRKYLKSENRVGTLIETAQVHSSHSDNTRVDVISGDDTFDDGKGSNFYEHIEAINPFAGNYANQQRRQFVEEKTKNGARLDVTTKKHGDTASTIQTDIFVERNQRENERRSKIADAKLKSAPIVKNVSEIDFLDKKLSKHPKNPNDKTDHGDAISVGSFLSMASVRRFPKCNVPEPLNRVLNYDDDIEAAEATNRVPRIVDTKLKNDGRPTTRTKNAIDDGKFTYLTRTRSDGADPGVIGPVVWQMHKKKQEMNDSLSPLRDPIYERNRYEGLLEGAMNLYTIETTEMHSAETAVTNKEYTDTATMREETQRKSIYASKVLNEN